MAAPIPFGNYELLERIAEGGMAEVWRARSRGVAGFEKTVVIKRVLPSLLERPGFAELLVREAKIAARLSHPNIVQIYELGEEEGGYYIAMELLRGRDLAAALTYRARAADAPLTLPLRLWIAAEVAKALDYAHRAEGDDGKPLHLVHRDVSPQNVLLGFEGEVKVADFGIARADEPGLGRGEDPKILRGKYAYMSPEQARGEPLDRRSDLFSFSIVLFELMTTRRMFHGKTSAEALELVRRAELPDYTRGLPIPGLREILARGLAPRREDRYPSAGEMHQALTRVLFSLGAPVGQTDLALAMRAMFPPLERVRPNKLRGDPLARAYDDAAAASDPDRTGPQLCAATAPSQESTRAISIASRSRDARRLVFLAALARPDDERLFAAAISGSGGELVRAERGLLLAAYGAAGMERAALHAARGALALRHASRVEGVARLDRAPALAVLAGEARFEEDGEIVSDAALFQHAAALLARTAPGEIRVASGLRAELGHDLRLREDGAEVLVDGARETGARSAPWVGRRELLRELSSVLLDTARGRGALVHLVGEPGVGKSRLLAELRRTAAPSDFVFVCGRADEADVEHGRAFGAFEAVVSDLAGVEPEDTPGQRFEKVERLRELGLAPREVRGLGELLGLAYPVASEPRPGRTRAIELALTIRKAIRGLAERRAVVLAIEDLQWMDDATRQVLGLLIDELERSRVLVLLTRRPGADSPAAGRTLEVPALDVAATGVLLAHGLDVRAVDPALAAQVHRETAGIPAWIELLAEPLRARVRVDDGVAALDPSAEVERILPDAIRTVVAARLGRLRSRDRSLLRTSAALGGRAEVRLVSAVEGLVGHTERPAVRRLLMRRLWRSDDADSLAPERLGAWGGDEEDERLPARVRVPSELLRRAVLAELDPAELRRLHARIVSTLERLGEGDGLTGLEQMAWHAGEAGDRRRAREYALRAAEQAEPARAAEHFLRAAAWVREERADPADAEAFDLVLRGVEAALAGGAIERAPDALAMIEGVDVRGARAVRRAIAVARWSRRALEPERARAAFEASRDALSEVEPELCADALAWEGWALLESDAVEAGVAHLQAALDEAPARGRLSSLLAVGLARLDRLEEADAAAHEALAIAARTGEGALRYEALAATAVVLEAQGELETAAARYREAAEVAEAVAMRDELAALAAKAAVLSMWNGDHPEASAHARSAERWARQLGQRSWAAVASALLASLARPPEIGLAEQAIERLDGRPRERAMALEALGLAHASEGDMAGARRALERAAELAEDARSRAWARRLRERLTLLDDARSPT